MNQLFLIPAPGRLVRDPLTRAPLPAEGELKPANGYWTRRLRDGDVVLKTETDAAAPAAAQDADGTPRKARKHQSEG